MARYLVIGVAVLALPYVGRSHLPGGGGGKIERAAAGAIPGEAERERARFLSG